MKKLTHLDRKGRSRMVDVTDKITTIRQAVAVGAVHMKKSTLGLISSKEVAKGDVIETARIAGIMGAKRVPGLIPLCHQLNLSSVSVDFRIDKRGSRIVIKACVRCSGQTGVEMEALTAVSVAALTIYDMCKSVDRGMTITDIMLIEKSGGRSGRWKR